MNSVTDDVAIAFRGTELDLEPDTLRDLATDALAVPVGGFHAGFYRAFSELLRQISSQRSGRAGRGIRKRASTSRDTASVARSRRSRRCTSCRNCASRVTRETTSCSTRSERRDP